MPTKIILFSALLSMNLMAYQEQVKTEIFALKYDEIKVQTISENKPIPIFKTTTTVKKNEGKSALKTEKQTYFQIASLSKRPTNNYLKNIQKNGFKYKIETVGTNFKVLIGPYKKSENFKKITADIKKKLKVKEVMKKII